MAAHYFDAVAEHFLRARESLPYDLLGRLFTAFLDYAYNGRPFEEALGPVDSGSIQTFRIMKEQIDHRRGVSERCLTSHREKKAEKERERENEKERTKEKVKDKVKSKGEIKERENGEPLPRFTPPTPDDIAAYLRKEGLKGNAELIHAYYSARGWRTGPEPMEDWKYAVKAWALRDLKDPSNPVPVSTRGKRLPIQDYSQRDYSGMQAQAMQRFIAANTEEEQS